MKYLLALVLASALATTAFTQTTTTQTTEAHQKTSSDGADKEVKTNGEISTSGCETKEGKIITEAEQGYDECVRQVGTKHKKKHKKK